MVVGRICHIQVGPCVIVGREKEILAYKVEKRRPGEIWGNLQRGFFPSDRRDCNLSNAAYGLLLYFFFLSQQTSPFNYFLIISYWSSSFSNHPNTEP